MRSLKIHSRETHRLALVLSLGTAMLLVFTLVQALTAANSNITASQDEPLPEMPGRVITNTDGSTTIPSIDDYIAGHTITLEELRALKAEGIQAITIGAAPTDFVGSSKQVDRSSAQPGAALNYTIVLSNSGGIGQTVDVTDTLPVELAPPSTIVVGGAAVEILSNINGNVITWQGTVGANSTATLSFSAVLTDTAVIDSIITNTAQIDNGSLVVDVFAETVVVSQPPTQTMYMPIVFRALPALTLQATRPNSANQWSLSWTNSGPVSGVTYELQESNNPTFQSGVTTYASSQLSRDIVKPINTQNVYYYRVRSVKGDFSSGWSNTVQVVGGYRDDFTSNTTGWEVRRTTYIEEVQSFYEIDATRDWMILRVEDSWDWGIASALNVAPQPPYVIEYRVMPANLGNLVSFGVAFGGDWNGAACPDKTSVAGWYQHTSCFNQFYNTNTIWFSSLKLLFERVDQLVWCPTCGGSPMKRLGDITSNNLIELNNAAPNTWNTYRIEVRASDIRFFVNGSQKFTYTDTRYINRPYFGIFASTDEYSNSTARFDYISVTPLDN